MELDLSSNLINADGFGNLTINNGAGTFYVPANVTLTVAPGGSISVQGVNILIDGNISAPGGTLAFTAYDYSPFSTSGEGITPPPLSNSGSFTLAAGASLSVAGLIVDDLSTPSSSGTVPLVTSGGTITLTAYNAKIAQGSVLNVSGGLQINQAGAISYGNGGSLSILAAQDPGISSLVGGRLTLDAGATLEGFSGATGGSITVQAQMVQIGDSPNGAGNGRSGPYAAAPARIFQPRGVRELHDRGLW